MSKRRDEEEQIAYHQAMFGSAELDNDERMTGAMRTNRPVPAPATDTGATGQGSQGTGDQSVPTGPTADIIQLLPGAMGTIRLPLGAQLVLMPLGGSMQSMTLKPGALQAYPAEQTAPNGVVYAAALGGPTQVNVGWTDPSGALQASSILITVG